MSETLKERRKDELYKRLKSGLFPNQTQRHIPESISIEPIQFEEINFENLLDNIIITPYGN